MQNNRPPEIKTQTVQTRRGAYAYKCPILVHTEINDLGAISLIWMCGNGQLMSERVNCCCHVHKSMQMAIIVRVHIMECQKK